MRPWRPIGSIHSDQSEKTQPHPKKSGVSHPFLNPRCEDQKRQFGIDILRIRLPFRYSLKVRCRAS